MASSSTEYGRLQKIATIGSAAGSVWSQRSFQVHCESLAQCARWWQEFRVLDIPFVEALFQETGSNYQKSLVPMLLYKTGGDLDLVLEFAQVYHISGYLALTEMTLFYLSISGSNFWFTWMWIWKLDILVS